MRLGPQESPGREWDPDIDHTAVPGGFEDQVLVTPGCHCFWAYSWGEGVGMSSY